MKNLAYFLILISLILTSCNENKAVTPEKVMYLKRYFLIESKVKNNQFNYSEYSYINNKLDEIKQYVYDVPAIGDSIISVNTVILKYSYIGDNVSEINWILANKDTLQTHYFKFNAQNQLGEVLLTKGKKIIKQPLYAYLYNSEGKVIEQKMYEYNTSTPLIYYLRYSYEPNNVVIKSYYDLNNKLFGQIKYTYDGIKRPYVDKSYPFVGTGNLIKIEGTEKYQPVNGSILFYLTGSSLGFQSDMMDIKYELNEFNYPTRQEAILKINNQKYVYGYEYY